MRSSLERQAHMFQVDTRALSHWSFWFKPCELQWQRSHAKTCPLIKWTCARLVAGSAKWLPRYCRSRTPSFGLLGWFSHRKRRPMSCRFGRRSLWLLGFTSPDPQSNQVLQRRHLMSDLFLQLSKLHKRHWFPWWRCRDKWTISTPDILESDPFSSQSYLVYLNRPQLLSFKRVAPFSYLLILSLTTFLNSLIVKFIYIYFFGF